MFPFAPLRRAPFRISHQFLRHASTTTSTSTKPKGIKALMKVYGLPALGVYLGLSLIDLPLCYILVHSMGSDKIEIYENRIKNVFGYGMNEQELRKCQELREKVEVVEETHPNLWKTIINSFSWTEFAIAYGVHKSFIFIRLPITAAITPAVVRLLSKWGFNIGRATTAATTATTATTTATTATTTATTGKIIDATASNPKFGTRPTSNKKWWWFF